MKILDVGCGNNKAPGAIGIDLNPKTQADVIHDLNCYPYPFPDSEFDLIIANHIVEHVDDVLRFMEELHRLGRPGALVRLVTPHFSNRYSYADPTHRHHLSVRFVDFFAEPQQRKPGFWGRLLETAHPVADFYSSARFEIVSRRLSFARPFRWLGIQALANRFTDFYELYLAFVLPARDIYIELRVVK